MGKYNVIERTSTRLTGKVPLITSFKVTLRVKTSYKVTSRVQASYKVTSSVQASLGETMFEETS